MKLSEFKEMYYSKTNKEIMKELNISMTTLSRLLEKYDIKRKKAGRKIKVSFELD